MKYGIKKNESPINANPVKKKRRNAGQFLFTEITSYAFYPINENLDLIEPIKVVDSCDEVVISCFFQDEVQDELDSISFYVDSSVSVFLFQIYDSQVLLCDIGSESLFVLKIESLFKDAKFFLLVVIFFD